QLLLTPTYAEQTISNIIIDIGTPPSGELTPFNVYVALSCSRGKDSVQLFCDLI
ncbi:hypothetical protein PAXRUDRAFT_144334, partial [Paxillus rubicundulus Ve08.2h10]